MRGVTPGWLTFRKPRKRDVVAIKPNAYRWGLGTSASNFFENCEKKNGIVDGGAVQAFHGDRRRQARMSRDCLQRGSTLVFVEAIAAFYSVRCGAVPNGAVHPRAL